MRRNKCITDDRGRTVWNVPIENTEDDDDLMAALDSAADVGGREIGLASEDAPTFDDSDGGEDELSLVSTQMLRQLLDVEDSETDEAPPPESGFNPYDHN